MIVEIPIELNHRIVVDVLANYARSAAPSAMVHILAEALDQRAERFGEVDLFCDAANRLRSVMTGLREVEGNASGSPRVAHVDLTVIAETRRFHALWDALQQYVDNANMDDPSEDELARVKAAEGMLRRLDQLAASQAGKGL